MGAHHRTYSYRWSMGDLAEGIASLQLSLARHHSEYPSIDLGPAMEMGVCRRRCICCFCFKKWIRVQTESWLVIYLPLWKIRVRQWGWWHSSHHQPESAFQENCTWKSPDSSILFKRSSILTRPHPVQSWSTSSKLFVVQDEGLEGFSSGGSFSTSAVPTWSPG